MTLASGPWSVACAACRAYGNYSIQARARIEELLGNAPAKVLVIVHKLYQGTLPAAPVDRMLLERLEEATSVASGQMSYVQLVPWLGDEPDRQLIPPLIKLVRAAGSYQTGEAVLKWVNALSPSLTEDDLHQLLEVAAHNDQIYGSVLGNRQLATLRLNGPQGEQAAKIWASWDARWQQSPGKATSTV
ncbi:hypothetical protein ACIP4T_31930 [Streptomyces massasporeus]|uniref:hypothetical protein n=1 Tax=Streptomyces massasporeus TaxID=67324 RepID=UPI0036E20FDE